MVDCMRNRILDFVCVCFGLLLNKLNAIKMTYFVSPRQYSKLIAVRFSGKFFFSNNKLKDKKPLTILKKRKTQLFYYYLFDCFALENKIHKFLVARESFFAFSR